MKRVASLYLPNWSIDRIRRNERHHAPPPEPRTGQNGTSIRRQFDAIGAHVASEREYACSVPKKGGWRPGARWAKAGDAGVDKRRGVETAIAALPQHQRPPQRELGRVSEAAQNPYRADSRARQPEDWAPPLREMTRRSEAAEHPFKSARHTLDPAARRVRPSARDGHNGEAGCLAPPDLGRLAALPPVHYPGEGVRNPAHPDGRFFQTGRALASVVARVCPEHEDRQNTDTGELYPPMVTVARNGARIELIAVCPAAAALGLRRGMALVTARTRAPDLIVRDSDQEGDAVDLARLADLLARRWSPTVMVSDADGILVDLTGVAHLHGGEQRFASRLVALLARYGIAARIGIAGTAGAAWALARYGYGNAVSFAENGAESEAIAPYPPASLRLDDRSRELLARLGVNTVGQLLEMPRAPLVRRFGTMIVSRLDQAIGHAAEPLIPVRPAQAIRVTRQFNDPIATAPVIEYWLGQLVPDLVQTLAQAGRGARSIELIADRVDGVPQRLRVGFARPTRDAGHILRMIVRRIEEIAPGYGIDAMTLCARRSDRLGPETLIRVLSGEEKPELATLVDAVINRIGQTRLWRLVPVESDVPERSVKSTAPLDGCSRARGRPAQNDIRQFDERPPDHPWHPRWSRPVRLLRRPEKVDHVLAELPDQPPKRFTWRGQSYRIVAAEGPERIAGEWWHRATERDAVRDYYRVEVETGQRFWLYRRGDGVRTETGDLTWYIHGR